MPPKFNLNSKVRSPIHILLFCKTSTNIVAKTIQAPLAAFCMASILFVYARTSIQAAKRNAQQHREADGGQINWHNENLRRHGKLEKPVEGGVVRQLAGREEVREVPALGETVEERRVRERRGR